MPSSSECESVWRSDIDACTSKPMRARIAAVIGSGKCRNASRAAPCAISNTTASRAGETAGRNRSEREGAQTPARTRTVVMLAERMRRGDDGKIAVAEAHRVQQVPQHLRAL